MTIQWSALFKAVGVAAVILILFMACQFGINAALGIPFGSLPTDPSAIPPEATLVGFAMGCIGYLLYLGYGALYTFFAARSGVPMEAGPMAVGGAATGIVIALISAILGLINTLIMLPQMSELFAAQGLDSPEMAGFMMAGAGIGLIFGLCVAFVLGGGLAAAGAAIYAAAGNRQGATPAM